MFHKKIRPFRLAALLLASSLFAQDQQALLGKWSMTSETRGDLIRWTLVLKDVGGKLTAFLASGATGQLALGFTYVDGVLKFKAPYEGRDYDIELHPVGEKLQGSWSGAGDAGKTTGSKAE